MGELGGAGQEGDILGERTVIPLPLVDATAPARGTAKITGKARQENFPVASYLLPRRYRRHLMAVYLFARLVDDIGDEYPGDRRSALDAAEGELDTLFAGRLPASRPFQELAATVRACRLDRAPFDRLIEANRQDQTVTRYGSYQQLLDYCTLSANPVGELVLGVFGVRTPDRVRLSNKVCTALQLLEHCQDVAEDMAAGRIYLPAEDLDLFGATEEDLRASSTSPAVRAGIACQVRRAVSMLDDGAALVGTLRGAARLAIAGYVAGGYATAEALSRAGFDVLGNDIRPARVVTAARAGRLLLPGVRV